MADVLENVTSRTADSTSETPVVDESLHSYGVLVFIACVWTLVAVLGIVGNSMVILAAVLSTSVRTSTNVFVVNLSAADLWTSLSLPWTSVALISNGNWPLATVAPCQIAAFMWHTGLGASLYNLALISVNRLVRITRSMSTYSLIYTPRKIAVMVVLSWLIPFFIIVFPIAIGVGALGHDLKHDTCTDDDLHPKANAYNLVQTMGFYPVPMLTVVVCYLVIYIHVRRHFSKQVYKKSASAASTDPIEVSTSAMTSMQSTTEITGGGGGDSSAVENQEKKKHKVSRQQLQITKNLFYVCCAFTLCISPYFISLFIPGSESFALYGATIIIFNSCINPIIYAVKHPQFKPVLRSMMRCHWSQIPNPSKTLQTLIHAARK